MLALIRSTGLHQLRAASLRASAVGVRVRWMHADAEVAVQHLAGDEQGVAVLSLNRAASRNAIGKQMLHELEDTLASLQRAPAGDVRALVVRSLVPRVFCAGADLRERSAMTPAEAGAFVERLRGAFTAVANLPMPVIACVEGFALGGGLELALCADMIVASASSALGLPETGLAIIPGAGGTQRLVRAVGPARAKELIFTARRITAAEAHDIGLLQFVADDEHAFGTALDLARDIARNGPIAVRAAKAALSLGSNTTLDVGLRIEQECYGRVLPTEDRTEGLTAFREKRRPVYEGK